MCIYIYIYILYEYIYILHIIYEYIYIYIYILYILYIIKNIHLSVFLQCVRVLNTNVERWYYAIRNK